MILFSEGLLAIWPFDQGTVGACWLPRDIFSFPREIIRPQCVQICFLASVENEGENSLHGDEPETTRGKNVLWWYWGPTKKENDAS